MSKVTLWRAADGSLHETHKAFLAHEAKGKIVEAINDGSVKLDWSLIETFDEVQGSYIDTGAMGEFIALNAEKLKVILDDALVNKRKSGTVSSLAPSFAPS